MCLVLHGGCSKRHMHSHLSSEQGNNQSHQNINVRAAVIHVLGDLIQSIGVFISSLVIKFYVSLAPLKCGDYILQTIYCIDSLVAIKIYDRNLHNTVSVDMCSAWAR